MFKNNENLEKKIKKIQDDEENVIFKKWNQNLFSKIILLFPSLVFLISFLMINNDKSIVDLINFILIAVFLVSLGVILNFITTKK